MDRKRDEQDLAMLRMHEKTHDKAAIAIALDLSRHQVTGRIASIRAEDIAHDPAAEKYWGLKWGR